VKTQAVNNHQDSSPFAKVKDKHKIQQQILQEKRHQDSSHK
jgi:hypothetical protein